MVYNGVAKPLYLQLKSLLVEQIESGKFKEGHVLPGERTLANQYDVSRVTVRKCIEALAEEGFVTRIEGKQTVVNRKRINHRLGDLLGIREELLQISKEVKVVELYKGYEPVQYEVGKSLNLGGSNQVYAFVRLFLVENKPVLINYSYISPDKGKLIDDMDLSKVLIFSHLENCGYKISFAEQEISAGIGSTNEEQYLDYAAGRTILIRKRTTYLEGGYPILYDKCIYRGDSYGYSIKLARSKIRK
ncbi:MAG: GntR family transcriptional regulator [Clostridia bacterium]